MALTERLVNILQHVSFLNRVSAILPSPVERVYLHQGSRASVWICKFFKLLARAAGYRRERLKSVTYVHEEHRIVMNLDVNETSQCEYYFFAPNQALKEAIVKGGNTFIDIGANVGIFSLMAAHFYREVLAIEPLPENLERLRHNLDLSNIHNVSIFDCGLSNKSAMATLHVNPMNLGGSTLEVFADQQKKLARHAAWTSHELVLLTLDEVLQMGPVTEVNLIKIDVEGHEVQVIEGALKSLQKFHPKLFVEVSTAEHFAQITTLLPAYRPLDPVTMQELTAWKPFDIFYVPR